MTEVKDVDLGYWNGEIEHRHKAGSLALFSKDDECRGFWRLALGNGCHLGCSYCFLSGTFPYLTKPVIYNDEPDMRERIGHWLEKDGHLVLNTGELSDGLAFDDVTGFSTWSVPLFEEQDRHTLLFLTKTTQIENLLGVAKGLDRQIKNTIVSWSINAPSVSEKYEGIAPSTRARILAAAVLKEAGYRVRLRIDPLVPVPDWQRAYSELLPLVERVNPERITIGSLRFLPRTAQIVKSQTPELVKFTSQLGRGRWRIPLETRVLMYMWMAEQLKPLGIPVALCKEPEEVRSLVGLTGPCHCEP